MTKRIALLAAALLLSAAPLYAGDAEDAAIKGVMKAGGEVTHEDDDPAKPVVAVNFSGTKATDADLKGLVAFTRLEMLALDDTQVTDAGMKDVAALKRLKVLTLIKTQVGDKGVKSLAALKGLGDAGPVRHAAGERRPEDRGDAQGIEVLNIPKTQVTDDGLKSLTGLKALQQLILSGTSVTDAGVAVVKKAMPDCDITN